MRHPHTANFCVTQVHQDHVQIIDEDKQAAWNVFFQSDEYRSTLQKLRNDVKDAQAAFDHAVPVHQQSLNNESTLAYAEKRLRKAEAAVQSHLTPDYYCDVPFDSIFSFVFALDNGLCIVY